MNIDSEKGGMMEGIKKMADATGSALSLGDKEADRHDTDNMMEIEEEKKDCSGPSFANSAITISA